MLLTITTTHSPATDLGYLLHKRPDRAQRFSLSFGSAHVFYPQATERSCTAALMLDIDAIALVKNQGKKQGGLLAQYVNDRPYVASSFLSVAIAQIFGSALNGKSRERADLASMAIPLHARIAVLPCRGGESLLRRLFEPLGYAVSVERHPLDERFPEWGDSDYFTVTLEQKCRLADLLTHLYVLVPVLDDEKHYWVGQDEVEKLLRQGKGWLEEHPEQKLIARRYLRHQSTLTHSALSQLLQDRIESREGEQEAGEEQLEVGVSLNEQRLQKVLEVLKSLGARQVVDLGCGEGKLVRAMAEDGFFQKIVGVDVSHRALQAAKRRLSRMPDAILEKIRLLQGSVLYRDQRLNGYDAFAIVEVIEHLDPPRLSAFEKVVFEQSRPRAVVMTTPNAEYNARFETLNAGAFRHGDHRFEWGRAELQDWANSVAERNGYQARFETVGPVDDELGSPTQMAIFELAE